jgi:hypothetical protein
MTNNSYNIEKVSNGYIVTDSCPERDRVATRGISFATRAPHVFESFGSMVKWLEGQLEPRTEQGEEQAK